MSKLSSILNTFYSLTGISVRHNRALRDVKEWIGTIQKFLTMYNLYGSPNFDLLLEKIGEAKLDLTGIAYRARPLIKTSKNIKGQMFSPLIEELNDSIENLRRALSNPDLYHTKLSKDIHSLRISFEKLQELLSEAEYK